MKCLTTLLIVGGLVLAASAPPGRAQVVDPEPGVAFDPIQSLAVADRRKVSEDLLSTLVPGSSVEAIVGFVVAPGFLGGALGGSESTLEARRSAIEALWSATIPELRALGIEVVETFSHLPNALVRLHSRSALAALLQRTDVRSVYRNAVLVVQPLSYTGLDDLGARLAHHHGLGGAGTSVLILDTGIDVADPEFGCLGIAVPESCPIRYAKDNVGEFDLTRDSPQFDFHGTKVAKVLRAVAPEVDLLSRAVFTQQFFGNWGVNNLDLLIALNWAIAHRDEYGIVAVNMSFASGRVYDVASCPIDLADTFGEVENAGIALFAGAGNGEDSYWDGTQWVKRIGMVWPACAPGTVSVTAGGSTDYDATTDFIAPGTWRVTANGKTRVVFGTSLSSPAAAGTWALLKSERPELSLAEGIQLLKQSGEPVEFVEAGLTLPLPRIDAALDLADPSLFLREKPFSPIVAGGVAGDFDCDGREEPLFVSGTQAFIHRYDPQRYDGGFDDGQSIVSLGPAPGGRPYAGDFAGNGCDDVLWFDNGKSLILWTGGGSAERGASPFQAARRLARIRCVQQQVPEGDLPVGDFNGDGKDDLYCGKSVWNAFEIFVMGSSGIEPTMKFRLDLDSSHVLTHFHRPYVGDFNGDGADDIFWYGFGSFGSVFWDGVWFGRSTLTESSFRPTRRIRVDSSSVRPFVGDFNGDRISDVFLYDPSGRDRVMLGGYGFEGSLTEVPTTVNGRYDVASGDFNADFATDILWVPEDGTQPQVWLGTNDNRGYCDGSLGSCYVVFEGLPENPLLEVSKECGAPLVGNFDGVERAWRGPFLATRADDLVWRGCRGSVWSGVFGPDGGGGV